jgi:hypothetical protein
MFSINYERYIHYKNHIYNQDINYIRLTNCKYCKQDKRDYYGSQFRQPFNLNRNEITNMNLLNYTRIQDIIVNNTNIRNGNIRNGNIRNGNIRNGNIRNGNIRNGNIRNLSRYRRQPIHRPFIQNFFPSNLQTHNQIQNNINMSYFTNNLAIQPLWEENFEELMDVEVKTILQDVNKGTKLEVYYGVNNLYCTICCEDITNSQIIRKINCEHKFHYNCIDEWLETNTKCPICRFSIETYSREIDEI